MYHELFSLQNNNLIDETANDHSSYVFNGLPVLH